MTSRQPAATFDAPAHHPLPPAAAASLSLACPLCAYNLTGLTRPQCPECGHTFEWDEFTNPAKQNLPWLFEHRRGLRGYLSTQLRLLTPRRFWQSLRPTHTLRPSRLLLFSLLSALLVLLLPPLLSMTILTPSIARDNLFRRNIAKTPSLLVPSLTTQGIPATPANLAAEKAALLSENPTPLHPRFYWHLLRTCGEVFLHNRPRVFLTFALTSAAALPVSTLAVLLVLRQSFSRARIRRVHLLRVAVYSADLLPLGVLASLVLLGHNLCVFSAHNYYEISEGLRAASRSVALLPLLLAPLTLLRLHAALRHYLCLPHPRLITAAIALIAALLIPAAGALLWPVFL